MAEYALVTCLRAAGCVFAEEEAALLTEAAGSPGELEEMTARRVAGEPLEYVVGWADFAGVRVVVEPGVFVPRHRTELMVEEADRLLGGAADPVVLDLCCGTGALAKALAARRGIEVWAADVDPVAVRCARVNLPGAEVLRSDLFEDLPDSLRGLVRVLLANVPYVPTEAIATMPPEARDHEHRVTLDGGADGLDTMRRVAAGAPGWLAPGGSVLIESSPSQVDTMLRVLETYALKARPVTSEDGDAVVVVGTRPG